MRIIIRKAKDNEIPIIDKLGDELVSHHSKNLYTKDDRFYNQKKKNSSSIWKKHALSIIKNKKNLALIAYYGEKPIGYCLSLIKRNIPIYKIEKYVYISDIYVDEKYRKQGIGKKFMEEVKKFYKKQKIKFLELQLNHNNDRALKFYQKYGFKEYHKTLRMRI
ncbi:MAG: GNAT family N-acetyltransferase [Nanoarchaeota archaeon]|nr:GNAT family N-acetyltransferase [Nanoarchaeota archaeon]